MEPNRKPLSWVGSSRKDLRRFPKAVREDIGFALDMAQLGQKHPLAKPLQGFHGAGVLEIVEAYDGDAYRAVYTVRFEEAVFVLHCFQKKSKSGIATPQQDIELIRSRLADAEGMHQQWLKRNP